METGIIKLTPELIALIGNGSVEAISPFTREIYLLDIVVSGTTYCNQIDKIEPLLLPDTVLKMIRKPNNNYDEQAIGIYFEKSRIGWIPKEENAIISRLMDAGKAFFCRIENTLWKGKWLKINAKVFMVE